MHAPSSRLVAVLCFVAALAATGHCRSDSVIPRLPAIGADYLSSGNTHGGFIRLSAGFEKGRYLLAAGPMLQLATGKINGARITCYRNISAAPLRAGPGAQGSRRFDRAQFGFTAYLQYVHRAKMSSYVRAQEERVVRGSFRDFGQVVMSTAETGIAIEMRLNITRNLCWHNSGGMSLHWHTEYHPGISREKVAFTLGIASGLLYVFDRAR